MSDAQRDVDQGISAGLDISGFKRMARDTDFGAEKNLPLSPDKTHVIDKRSSRGSRVQAMPSSGQTAHQLHQSAMIAQINSGVAHQIRSAQVVLDPASVIKELLENALDAGATRIDIRVRGKAALDSIAVSDNGKGIATDDYASLCLSASTSKISNFEDLDSVMTFGFRGEALSAICAIAKSVSFVTRTKGESVATSLKYGPDGSLQEKRPIARPLGTTALVDTLFHKLPVRRKDALKNSSREVARCVSVVQALALISVGVRIELRISQDVKVLTQPNACGAFLAHSKPSDGKLLNLRQFRHTASCVLGNKTAAGLLELSCKQIATVSLPKQNSHPKCQSSWDGFPSNRYYYCSGLVSKASLDVNGSGGRAKSSYQYIFANKRPVDFPRLIRSANELYRRITGLNGASPVLLLNLELPVGSHDVNLSPDKRDLLIRDESDVIAGVMSQLETLWAPKKAAEIPIQKFNFRVPPVSRPSSSHEDNTGLVTRGEVLIGGEAKDQLEKVCSSLRNSFDGSQQKEDIDSRRTKLPHEEIEKRLDCQEENSIALERPSSSLERKTRLEQHENSVEKEVEFVANFEDIGNKQVNRSSAFPGGRLNSNKPASHIAHKLKSATERREILATLCPGKRNVSAFISRQLENLDTPTRKKKKRDFQSTYHAPSRNDKNMRGLRTGSSNSSSLGISHQVSKPTATLIDEPGLSIQSSAMKSTTVLTIDWDNVCKEQLSIGSPVALNTESNPTEEVQEVKANVRFQRASIADENSEKEPTLEAAELEMSRLFQQEWFGKLKILGQFNRGFIIGQLGQDLFIIDQHASDEKYNFEDLQRSTTISKQKLVRPLGLEFSAQDELIVLQHKEAFRAGGFEIEYRAGNRPTQRLYLRSQPVSKSTMFVQDDLKEIVAMLKSNVLHSSTLKVGLLRPPRVRAMFASRACRKSVMIGTALQKGQMRRIVRNLTSIEHPWTCPHGRPTMRHLCTLPEA